MKLTHKQFVATVCALFAILSAWGICCHEIWLDEAHHFLLARDTHSLKELYGVSRNSGHPLLWDVILFGYKYLVPTVAGMQLLHSLLALACVYLIARYSPFSRLQIVCICFGYYFLFEYNLIAKNYIPGILCLLIALVMFRKQRSPVAIALVLALAANCHLFTLIVSAGLMAYILVEPNGMRGKLVAAFIFLLAAIISVIQIVPPSAFLSEFESYDPSPLFSAQRIGRALGMPARGILNLPDYRSSQSWNTSLFQNLGSIVLYGLSVLIMILSFMSFRKEWRINLLFFVPLLGIMGVVYMMPLSVGTRYWGYAYLLLLLSFWLLKCRQPGLKVFQQRYLTAVVALQLLTGVVSFGIDISRPFSCARSTAAYVHAHALDSLPVFHELLATGPAYSAYSGNPVFYPASGTFESFSLWYAAERLDSGSFLNRCRERLTDLGQTEALLVANKDLGHYRIPTDFKIKPLVNFQHSIMSSENSYLYYISLINSHRNPDQHIHPRTP